MQVAVISGSERRRRWSAAEREEIVLASTMPSAVIAEVARRFGVATSLIYKWRRGARQAAGRFVPVVLTEDEGSAPVAAGSSLEAVAGDECSPGPEGAPVISVTLVTARIDIPLSAPPALVSAVLQALR
ncbi:transposase [Camelimonas abortus]|uniref:IS66-like element accessory protein TnpA n=1 Tax=Camelimonas abortus TaxID=1017184 RepID=UPI0035EA8647